VDQAFRAAVGAAGAVFMAYIPNQACLATATAGVAETLRHSPLVQAVLPYEPYYKLKGDLLGAALRGAAPPGAGSLNVLLFPGTEATTTTALAGLGAEVLAEETSPFGPVLRVRCSAAEEVGGTGLPARVAGLPGVQEIERGQRSGPRHHRCGHQHGQCLQLPRPDRHECAGRHQRQRR
jgi:hypothetical protein